MTDVSEYEALAREVEGLKGGGWPRGDADLNVRACVLLDPWAERARGYEIKPSPQRGKIIVSRSVVGRVRASAQNATNLSGEIDRVSDTIGRLLPGYRVLASIGPDGCAASIYGKAGVSAGRGDTLACALLSALIRAVERSRQL